ncbi:MAG: ABC transporter ATP-binding protein [Clostridiales bacterium]
MNRTLEINNLTKKYNNNRGIENVSIEVNQGDIYGFLGPNGAGKTTAMKIMTGLLMPDSGDIKVFGYNLYENYKKIMKNVGCLIENVDLYTYLTPYKNLKLAGRYYSINDTRIHEVLNITGIYKYKDEKVKNFSLGMKQRLGIAIAILHNPKLVILDEPLNGLDVEGMIDMRELIQKLSIEEKVTFFISSHLIHDVELTCNRIGLIYKGSLVNSDYTEEILKSHSSLEKYFISEVNYNNERN